MSWFAWLLIAYFALNMMAAIARVGKIVRCTAGDALLYMCIVMFMVWGAITQVH